jgi:hypothetical protein
MAENDRQFFLPTVGDMPAVSQSSEPRPPDRPASSSAREADQQVASDPSPPPVPVTAVPVASPVGSQAIAPTASPDPGLSIGRATRTDTCAVASAICGLTAIVPVISQVAGLVLGTVGMVRLRRARRAGRPLRGLGWAVTGLVSSGATLVGWVALFVAFGILGASLAKTTSSLDSLSKPGLIRAETTTR